MTEKERPWYQFWWRHTFKTVVRLMLDSRFAIWIGWILSLVFFTTMLIGK